jgi:hypothetical protein
MSNEKTVQVTTGSPFGCLGLILTVIVLWGSCFGVTYEGQHYGLSCSCAEGVKIEK